MGTDDLDAFAARARDYPNRLARAIDLLACVAALTARERAVLDHSLFGTPRADLPERLGVSHSTVKTLVSRLLRKLHQQSGSLQGAMALAHSVARCETRDGLARSAPALGRLLARGQTTKP